MSIRQPIAAGLFYPGEPDELTRTVNELLRGNKPRLRQNATAVMAPHAGYIYSGAICAEALQSAEIPGTVIILCPNHTGLGNAISVSLNDWQIPTAVVPTHQAFAGRLLAAAPAAIHDESAHTGEHAIEVQLPFLHALQPDLKIVAISLSRLNLQECLTFATQLAEVINNFPEPTLLLASSDMNHYESRAISARKDRLALDQIESMNPQGLYTAVRENRITMCGVLPMTVALQASLLLGADCAEILSYTDSGEVSGDTDSVVAYAGALLCSKVK